MNLAFSYLSELLREFEKDYPTQEAKAQCVNGMYSEMMAKVSPFLNLAPALAEKAGTDLVTVGVAFQKGLAAILANEDFQSASLDVAALRAKIRFAALKAYMDAGFKRPEALALVLQDIANIKAWQAQAAENASKSGSK